MTSIAQQPARKNDILSRIKRDLLYHAPRLLGGWLLARGKPAWALKALKQAEKEGRTTFAMLRQLAKASRDTGDFEAADEYQYRLRCERLLKHAKRREFVQILEGLVRLEKTRQAAPIEVGRLISQEIVKESGRALILRTALRVQKKHPHSVYLLHFITMCEAMQGDYRRAAQTIARELDRPLLADNPKEKQRFTVLRNCWRTVDLIAREQMDVIDDAATQGSSSEAPATKLGAHNEEPSEGTGSLMELTDSDDGTSAAESKTQGLPENNQPLLRFKEHYLQGRLHSEYLEACERDLADASTLIAKLRIISEMLRQGVRRVLSYADAYELATRRMRELIVKDKILTRDAKKAGGARQVVSELCIMLPLTRKLGMTKESEQIIKRLLQMSKTSQYKPILWMAAAEISAVHEDTKYANKIISNLAPQQPKKVADVKSYFRWAKSSAKYNEAVEMFGKLPAATKVMPCCLEHVNILERMGRFGEALKLVGDIHGRLLSDPGRVDPVLSHQLITRIGELRFLVQTAKIYKSVPQPKNPKGVVLVSPRNIAQLRLYPIMVLVEMKRQGWAVIPTIEGLLPREPTGIPRLDVMNGAITRMSAILPSRAQQLRDVSNFTFEPAKGILRWGEIDLSHPIWEDAAINRRCYNVDFGCPSLQRYVGGLASWTRCTARVLDYAHTTHKATGMRFATMSLFNNRVPDSLHRFFCEKRGNPDSFFFLHAANGYQNYFTNFSTNVSQRFVLRNMTRAGDVRSASFPIPANFERYYEERRSFAPEMLERFENVTKVKRSTSGVKIPPPEAIEAKEKILAWRSKGGKVAGAFGKVVCDSGLPYDGGPAHRDMKEWINHCVEAVKGSNTLLLIKPHPHEMNNEIATFPNEFFTDLIEDPSSENVMILGHRWFDMHAMEELIDIGLIYNGTTTIELGIMGIPCILGGHFAPIDYPIGHAIPTDKRDFEQMLRFEKPFHVASDIRERAACWLEYMANETFTLPYRYHTRPVTNKVLYPPTWYQEDLNGPSAAVVELTARALGNGLEPGAVSNDDIVPMRQALRA